MEILNVVEVLTVGLKDDVAWLNAGLVGRRSREDLLHGNAAVADSDVVITATPGAGPLFEAAAVQPGTHFNCVGADTKGKRELPEGMLEHARLFVDDRVQARQIGESQWAVDRPSTELGELLDGSNRVNRQATDVTVFDLTGLALQDLIVARLLHERAAARGIGGRIPWPW